MRGGAQGLRRPGLNQHQLVPVTECLVTAKRGSYSERGGVLNTLDLESWIRHRCIRNPGSALTLRSTTWNEGWLAGSPDSQLGRTG